MSFEFSFLLSSYKNESNKTNLHIFDIIDKSNLIKSRISTIVYALSHLMEHENGEPDEVYTLKYNGKSYSISHKRPRYNIDMGV